MPFSTIILTLTEAKKIQLYLDQGNYRCQHFSVKSSGVEM